MKIVKPICFFDLETTSVEVNTARIVEISVIKVDENQVITKHHFYVNPLMPIPKGASDIHGITDEKVQGCPTFSEIAPNLFEFFSGCDLGGYNSDQFDIPLLQTEFARVGMVFPEDGTNTVDVLKIERLINSHKLGDTYKRYTGNDLTDAHSAEADVLATIEILNHQYHNLSNAIGVANYTLEDVQQFCMGEKERVDFAGQLYRKDGEVYFNFGKNKDKRVRDDIPYAQWCLNANFSNEFKKFLRQALNPEN